jgi:hypothetical protein
MWAIVQPVVSMKVEVAAPCGNLQQLTQRLQGHLQLLPHGPSLQVQCALRQGKLMVLAQHPTEPMPAPEQVFTTLEVAIRTLKPEVVETAFESLVPLQEIPVQLYLRIVGQRYPYRCYQFQFIPGEFTPGESIAPEPSDSPEATKQIEANLDRDRPADAVAEAQAEVGDRSEVLLVRVASESSAAEPPESSETEVAEPDDKKPERVHWLPWIVAGSIVSLISFLGGWFILSRPCLLGSCEPFQMAQQLSQESSQTLRNAKSWHDLRTAQQQIFETNRLLDRVPAWSAQHREAEVLLQTQLSQATTLNQLLTIEAKADIAIQKSRNVPQPVKEWQAIQTIWQDAIAQLKSTPANSPLQPFVGGQLTKYQENLAAIEQYIVAEQQAQKLLQSAKSAEKLAETRQDSAQSLENWQLVQATWQTAVNALKQIPASTTSHTAVKPLLTDYEEKLATVRDRLDQEQIATKAYAQATSLAASARASESQNQWSRSVYLWQEALTHAKRIAPGTQRHAEAQALIIAYTNALQAAQTQLQGAVTAQKALEQTREDLDRICAGTPKTCTYSLETDLIRIRYTAAYEQALKTAFAAGQSGDYGALGGAVNHVETLQTALQTLASHAGLPIEVYSADGSELMGSFNPGG